MNVVVLPIESVTVLEDRAAVTRRGTVELPAGESTLRLEGVAPVLANKTVTASSTSATIRDVRVRRALRILDAALPEEKRRVADELAALDAHGEQRRRELALLVEEDAALARTEELSMRELGEDVAWDRLDADRWRASLNRLVRARVELAERITRAESELAEVDAQIARKRARLAVDPTSKVDAWLEIDAGATEAGPCEIVVSYVVPGACWRPQHTATLHNPSDPAGLRSPEPARLPSPPSEQARLVDPVAAADGGGKPRVVFACEGTVWQNTGEDWTDVELVLSTERPSLGADPPVLEADVLDVVPRSQTITVETRDQTVEEGSLGVSAGKGGAARPPGLPGIDDGGDARHLRAPHKQTIPSDGRPHRVGLFQFESAPRSELVVTAELAAAVFERTELENTATLPVLAGPVDLVKRGGPCGTTTVLYAAPGERFAVGWGPDASLRVQRTVDRLPSESTLLGNWTTETTDVEVRVSNLGGEAKRVRVVERVPVSEIEKVVVTVHEKETTDRKAPDGNGFVSWTLDLKPHGRAKVKLRASIKRHADVSG